MKNERKKINYQFVFGILTIAIFIMYLINSTINAISIANSPGNSFPAYSAYIFCGFTYIIPFSISLIIYVVLKLKLNNKIK